MEGPGRMDEDVERGGGTVDRRSLPPRSSEVACSGEAAPDDIVSDPWPDSHVGSGPADVAQQPEKLETMMVAEGLPAEERVIGGNEGSQVCAEGVGEGGGCKVRAQAREGCAKGAGERGVGEGGGQGMEYCAERVDQRGVGEVGGQGREECAEDAGGEVVGENGGQKRDNGAGGSNAEMEQNGAGREPGLPSEEDEEMEDFEGEEGEDDEEEGLEEDRGRCSMTPSSEPPERPSSRLNSAPHTSEFENGGFYDDEDDEDDEDEANEDEDDDDSEANAQLPLKKQKTLASLTTSSCPSPSAPVTDLSTTAKNSLPPTSTSAAASTSSSKKSKKKSNNVRRKPASRKGKKKGKTATANNHAPPEEKVLIAPIPRFPDRSDDSPDAIICLSKIYKAEKVELSEDRLTAGSTKGYRMVRATRGVIDGAWYFEISVLRLGETGHTRLGWTTEKGDLQAPVGYDGNSYGYRDIGGMKIHKALREKYGDDGYAEGDVIGCYINLPEGEAYAPKPPHLVWYKGQKYMYPADGKDDPPKVIPGSEIAFFKNGECQGTAFTDLFGGRYYPAASMYTLPNQPNCEVRFNFGPTFQRVPKDFGGRPIPRPMTEAPYHGYIAKVEGPAENGTDEKQSNGVSS